MISIRDKAFFRELKSVSINIHDNCKLKQIFSKEN